VGLLDRLTTRRVEPEPPAQTRAAADEPLCSTKALHKFVASVASKDLPVLLDLGPVVGGNVSFFGEMLGCKIYIEDLFADLDQHVRQNKLEGFHEFLAGRFPQPDRAIDGVLSWDIFDFLDRRSAQALARQLTRLIRPDGVLLGFFGAIQPATAPFTRHIIVDDSTLRLRRYGAPHERHAGLPNRDIQILFEGLHVSDSFLLQNSYREIFLRKPA
jgi:hypothetical protein